MTSHTAAKSQMAAFQMKMEKTTVISQEYKPSVTTHSFGLSPFPFLALKFNYFQPDFSLSQHNFPEYNLQYCFNAEMVSVKTQV